MDTSHDRILAGACAAVWLAVIGVSVAAIVALAALGSGRAGEPAPESSTPWGLYMVIGISAAIILAAIPLLLRARRMAQQEPPRRVPVPATRVAVESPTEKLRVFGSSAATVSRDRPGLRRAPTGSPPAGDLAAELVDRMWLRFTLSIATAMGAATLFVATATYCMGVRADGWAVAALVVAAIITALMPGIPWRQLRQLPT